jgi:hypothetical protein
MSAVGGPIQEISIRGRIFPVAADSDGTFKPGGYSSTIEPNGDGATARPLLEAKNWMLESVNLSVDHDRGDVEFLNERVADVEFSPISVTFISGHTWSGRGKLTGEVEFNHQKSTAAVSMGGPGKAAQQ